MAAELVDKGVKAHEIAEAVYETRVYHRCCYWGVL